MQQGNDFTNSHGPRQRWLQRNVKIPQQRCSIDSSHHDQVTAPTLDSSAADRRGGFAILVRRMPNERTPTYDLLFGSGYNRISDSSNPEDALYPYAHNYLRTKYMSKLAIVIENYMDLSDILRRGNPVRSNLVVYSASVPGYSP